MQWEVIVSVNILHYRHFI